LDGRYTWYLVPKGGEGADYSVVLDSRGTAIDRQALLRDLFCMEFAFGGPLRLDPLIGIDAHRRPVAAIGVERLARARGKHRAPVPDYIGQADAWVPVLFRCVSGKIHEEGLEPVIIAIAAYLDSVVDHLDGGYLKAQVGLEALAKRLVGGGRPEVLVHDEASLRAHIESHGGRVLLTTTLSASRGSEVLALRRETLQDLRRKHGDALERDWEEEFGYGLDALTEAEAGYLFRQPSLDAIRARLARARGRGAPERLPGDQDGGTVRT
jgi:hypothetical protein